jgi:xylan 1,4-beta-xylosidase
MVFQLKTFQGVRYALFSYNRDGAPGGYADFDGITVREPNPRGLTRPIPFGSTITIATADAGRPLIVEGDSAFTVVDRGIGRIALWTAHGYVAVDTVGGTSRVVVRRTRPTDAETLQWIETPYGDLALLSLATHRYLRIDPASGRLSADHRGPEPDAADGAEFRWVTQPGRIR